MSDTPPIIEGPYLHDVLDQPRALGETHARLRATAELSSMARRLAGFGFRRVVLSGMGSSLHALVPLQLRLVEAGHATWRLDSSELLHHQQGLLQDGTLLVLPSPPTSPAGARTSRGSSRCWPECGSPSTRGGDARSPPRRPRGSSPGSPPTCRLKA